jgi:predicted ATPase
MITAVQFRNFKALRSAALRLEPFNLFIGPSGSGKTSFIQALLKLRSLAGLAATPAKELAGKKPEGPQIDFYFAPPLEQVRVTLACTSDDLVCNALSVEHPPGPVGEGQWAEVRQQLRGIRAFLFDHYAMAVPARRTDSAELASNAANLAAVLAERRARDPEAMAHLAAGFCRILPEFSGLDFRDAGDGRVELLAQLADGGEALAAEDLSQGTLYLLAILCLAHDPHPPGLICIEEADRGVHPRLLREVRDAFYRLSHPLPGDRAPVQVIATTHSPYLLDLFREHPEEIVMANKQGNAATFERLSDRADLLELMKDTNLGDLWYTGILGGVPGE